MADHLWGEQTADSREQTAQCAAVAVVQCNAYITYTQRRAAGTRIFVLFIAVFILFTCSLCPIPIPIATPTLTHTHTESTHDKPRIAKKMLKWQHAPQDFVYAKHNNTARARGRQEGELSQYP